MPANQAQVVGQYVAIQLVAKLSTKGTAPDTADEAAKDGARYRSERDAQGAGNSTNYCTSLTTGQGSTGTTSGTAYSTNCCGDLHGWVE
ncbi:hypothetical protein HW090_17565 [Pseudomonas sp. ABC1]|nr:hypothetical protein HW090_17565 [Pseudomonas sp. ABC1]